MHLPSFKTYLGFFASMLAKHTGLNFSKNTLEGIYNYRRYDDNLSTSGQPSQSQFTLIKALGFTTVINLAPIDKNNSYKSAENCLNDEAGLLAELGIEYYHLPVDFQFPEETVYQTFTDLMKTLEGQKIWVHCAANMRVSAFLYRYRRDQLKLNEKEAREVMDTIWRPHGQWLTFLQPSK